MPDYVRNHLCTVLPGCHKSGEVGSLVVIYPLIGLQNEACLLAKGPDHTGALHCLVKVGVDGRAAHRLQTPELA